MSGASFILTPLLAAACVSAVAALIAALRFCLAPERKAAAVSALALSCVLFLQADTLALLLNLPPLYAPHLAALAAFGGAAAALWTLLAFFGVRPPMSRELYFASWAFWAVFLGSVFLPPLTRILAGLVLAVILVDALLSVITAYRRREVQALLLMPIMPAFIIAFFASLLAALFPYISVAENLGLIATAAGLFILACTLHHPALAADTSEKSAGPGFAQHAIMAARQGVWTFDTGTDRLSVSPAVEAMLGLPPGALQGGESLWRERIHPESRPAYSEALQRLIARGKGTFRLDMRMGHAEGHYLWVELRAGLSSETPGGKPRCTGLVANVSRRKEIEDQLIHSAVHDTLTDLPARPLFLDRLARLVESHRDKDTEEGKETPALILLNLERFRVINETLGHSGGDKLLVVIARRLEKLLAQGETLARIGADEFALLTQPCTPKSLAKRAQGILDSLRRPVMIEEREIFVSLALGLAHLDQHETGKKLLEDAQIAMQRAKDADTPPISVFTPDMRAADPRRLSLESDLRHALERKELSLFYQPIVTLDDAKVAGFEALLRWQHPEHGFVPPGEFIPLAEETGMIGALGRFALFAASREVGRWQLTYRLRPPLFVSVNISRRELFREDIVEDVARALRETHLAPGTLKLEVTENLFMSDPERAGRVLTRIKAAGAGLAMDDFGSGYSSLGALKDLPFDMIKIDGPLVRGIEEDATSRAIIRAVLALGEELGMDVVAEGINMPAEAASLRRAGCVYGQGFCFAHPMRSEDVRAYLPRNRPR